MVKQPDWFWNSPGQVSSIHEDAFSNYAPDFDPVRLSFNGAYSWDPAGNWKIITGDWDLVEAYPGEVSYLRQRYVWGPQPQNLIGGGWTNITKWWPTFEYKYYGKFIDWYEVPQATHFYANHYSFAIEELPVAIIEMNNTEHRLKVGEWVTFIYGNEEIDRLDSGAIYQSGIGPIRSINGNIVEIDTTVEMGTFAFFPSARGFDFYLYPTGTITEVLEDDSIRVALDDGHIIHQGFRSIENIFQIISWENFSDDLYNTNFSFVLTENVEQLDGSFKDEVFISQAPFGVLRHEWPAVDTQVRLQQKNRPPKNLSFRFWINPVVPYKVTAYNHPYVTCECLGHRFRVGDWASSLNANLNGIVSTVISDEFVIVDITTSERTYTGSVPTEWIQGRFLRDRVSTNTSDQGINDQTKYYVHTFYPDDFYQNHEFPADRDTSYTTDTDHPNNFPLVAGTYNAQQTKNSTRDHQFLQGSGKIRFRQELLDENLAITVHIPRDKQANIIRLYFGCNEDLTNGYYLEYEPYPSGSSNTYLGEIIDIDYSSEKAFRWTIRITPSLRTYSDQLVDITWGGAIRYDIRMPLFAPDPCDGDAYTDWAISGFEGWNDPLPTLGTSVVIQTKPWGQLRLYGPNGLFDVAISVALDDLRIEIWRDGDGNLILGSWYNYATSAQHIAYDKFTPTILEIYLGDSNTSFPGGYIGLGGDGIVNIDTFEVNRIAAVNTQKMRLGRNQSSGVATASAGSYEEPPNPVFIPGTMPNTIKVVITGDHADGYNAGKPFTEYWDHSDRLGTYYLPIIHRFSIQIGLIAPGGAFVNLTSSWGIVPTGGDVTPAFGGRIGVGIVAPGSTGGSVLDKEYRWIAGDVLRNGLTRAPYSYTPVHEYSSSSFSSHSESSISTSSVSSSSSSTSSTSTSSKSSSISSSSISASSSSLSFSTSSRSSPSSSSPSSSSSSSSWSSESSVSSSSSSEFLAHLIDGRSFEYAITYNFVDAGDVDPGDGGDTGVDITETWTITPAHNYAPTIIDEACAAP